MSRKENSSSNHSPAVRILALALSLLVASGVVVYLITFFINLFGG